MRELATVPGRAREPAEKRHGAALHTATLRLRDGVGVLEVFHACRVGDAAEVRRRLGSRLGPALAQACTVRRGIDPADPIVRSLLPGGVVEDLVRHGDLPGRALSGGGDLHVVQRRG